MRLIHTFDNQKDALQFSNFLHREGIDNQCEIIANTDWGSSDYGTIKCLLWIIEEDTFDPAQRWLDEYLTNPDNPVFQEQEKWKAPLGSLQSSLKEVPHKISEAGRTVTSNEKKGLGFVTLYLFIACVVIFIYGFLTSPPLERGFSLPLPPSIDFSPIYKLLMYDYPKAYEIIDKLIKAYGREKLQNLAELPFEGRLLLETFSQTPSWQGIYGAVVDYLRDPNHPWNLNQTMFEKIREGEIWRLFSPILLHANFLHLFFNIIWLLVLGKLVEDKIGSSRYILFILIVAAISNTAQYLMSGPDFIGISGVICGLAGLIWARQKVAAWEGYNLMPGVISFMLVFVLGIAAIQTIAFFLQVFANVNFMPSIANTAHITGGITGYLLGRTNLFAMSTQ